MEPKVLSADATSARKQSIQEIMTSAAKAGDLFVI
jgi:hypothetical protein